MEVAPPKDSPGTHEERRLRQDDAEARLADAVMCCPRCGGALAKWGYARERTVCAFGAAMVTVRPRRVRCRDCATTHIVLPTALQPRRADTTEVIGTALSYKANGLGFRRIAARMGRAESTVQALAASRHRQTPDLGVPAGRDPADPACPRRVY